MRSGFTLVELSIVLVILGLLVGGILAGQSLIHASELRSVSSDYARYKTAMYTFRDKYFALPGDLTNATHFWGALAGAAPPATGMDTTCRAATAVPTGTETCNGNGDGLISESTSNYRYEAQHAWKQLGNAGLIEGNYTGSTASGNSWNTVIGVNIPQGKLNNGGFQIRANATSAAWQGNVIFYATSSGSLVASPVLTPEDAWNLDAKMDDGQPGAGKLQVHEGTSASCISGTAPTSTYVLTYSDVACALFYRLN